MTIERATLEFQRGRRYSLRVLRALKKSRKCRFDEPTGIAIDGSGRLYVVDTKNNRVQVFTNEGTFLGRLGTKLNEPSGIAIDDSGAVYVADTENDRIQVFDVES